MNSILIKRYFKNICSNLALCTVILIVSVYSIRAIPLAEYRQNVHQAMIALDALQSSGARERLANESATLAEVRRLLPVSQKIELIDQSTLEVHNDWLEIKLKEYQNAAGSTETKTKILLAAAEQLGAIENRLVELEKAAAGNYSKNSDKQKLDEILRRPEFKKPESTLR